MLVVGTVNKLELITNAGVVHVLIQSFRSISSYVRTVFSRSFSPVWEARDHREGILPIMDNLAPRAFPLKDWEKKALGTRLYNDYASRLRPKGVRIPFSGWRYIKGWGLHELKWRKS